MKITAEQIKELKSLIADFESSQPDFIQYMKSRESIIGNENFMHFADSSMERQYQVSQRDYMRAKKILKEARYVTERNTDQIDIGTIFKVRFNGLNREERLLMVEDLYLCYNNQYTKMVGLDSPLGKLFLGKKEGDIIESIIGEGNNRRKISCTIEAIEKDLSNYDVRFIRETPKPKRFCAEEARQRKALIKYADYGDEKSIEKLKDRSRLTRSQSELVRQELGTLPKNADIGTKKRLTQATKLISTLGLASPKTENQVEVGSIVTYQLDGEEKPQTREFINCAVSTEMEDEYIEGITSIGCAMRGLMPGDIFTYHNGHCKNKGRVISVVNQNLRPMTSEDSIQKVKTSF